MSRLVHCIYTSAQAQRFKPEELVLLLESAREKNDRLGITGMLLHHDGSFFQVLEGEQSAVESVFDRIAVDRRHVKVTRIIDEPIARRAFGNWSMGFAAVSRAQLEMIPGMNDFYASGDCLARLDAGRAKSLLTAFRLGRWRKSLSGERVIAHAA